MAVVVRGESARAARRARRLATRFGLPCADANDPPAEASPFELRVPAEAAAPLELVAPASLDLPSLEVDFSARPLARRAHPGRVHGELVVRAARVRATPPTEIIDATGGLGTDAWLFAAAGAQVTLCEREPAMAAMLDDALERAVEQPESERVAARIRLHAGPAEAVLAREASADVVYLDPLYPERRKAALGSGRLRTLARVASCEQGELEQLLDLALRAARARVVVKRPRKSPTPPAWAAPHRVLRGRSTRFDIWNAHSRAS